MGATLKRSRGSVLLARAAAPRSAAAIMMRRMRRLLLLQRVVAEEVQLSQTVRRVTAVRHLLQFEAAMFSGVAKSWSVLLHCVSALTLQAFTMHTRVVWATLSS